MTHKSSTIQMLDQLTLQRDMKAWRSLEENEALTL